MNLAGIGSEQVKRLLACLAGGVALAIMVGDQEGTQDDYGLEFRQSVAFPRILVFLGIGVVVYLAVTFWPRVVPYLTRPGIWPLAAGALTVIASLILLQWFTPQGNGKFGTVRTAVADTSGLSALSKAFFSWLAYALLIVVLVAMFVAAARRLAGLAWAAAGLAVVAGGLGLLAHRAVTNFAPGTPDHSLGAAVHAFGYLVIAVAGVSVARAPVGVARTRESFDRVLAWRPGLPVVAAGLVFGLLALGSATWFSPQHFDADLRATHSLFDPTGLAPLASQYLSWLAWALLAVTVGLSGAGSYLRNRALGLAGAVVGVVAVLLTLFTLHGFSAIGADLNVDSATGPWQNLGSGGWVACIGFFLAGAGGLIAAMASRTKATASPLASTTTSDTSAVTDTAIGAPADTLSGGVRSGSAGARVVGPPSSGRPSSGLPSSGLPSSGATSTSAVAVAERPLEASMPALPAHRMLSGSQTGTTLLLVAVAVALFYPPTATGFWQTVMVTEIAPYVLLAVGLNVVVGWAGLLDLGFIAFFAIGSYTTAYLVGSLPVKPPSWLQMSPLWAIPFAVAACLLAGVALGAPTLRLRGDYLAIVTLGFGEIIRLVAINNPGNFTNSTRGPSTQVPHPVIDLGFIRFEWALNPLQYWYLWLFFLVIVVILFYRLEGSRIGRAWTAIREDEVAAQATGINTVRVKLLAFAIGASTSGLTGVLFASQVGYFNPDNFVLNNSILVVAYVVFGGMGSLPGAMAGAAVLTWLPEFLRDQVPAEDRQMWIGAVVLIMMIFRPGGLIPARRRKAELSGFDHSESAETSAVPLGEGMGGSR
ncbi:MAG: hypothetical protein ABJA87_02535 [bacterium]